MGVIENIPGYVFDYYLIDGDKYKPMDVYKVSNKCVTFEKVYIKTDFKVTFMEDGAFYYEESVELYGTLETLPVVHKSGYEFLGWYDSFDIVFTENTKITENTTLYAKFVKINYINNISINIDKETYKVINKSENIDVQIYYDYNYVDVIIKPSNDYLFYHDIIIEIYFNGEMAKIISFNVNKDEINYILDDPNYTNRY